MGAGWTNTNKLYFISNKCTLKLYKTNIFNDSNLMSIEKLSLVLDSWLFVAISHFRFMSNCVVNNSAYSTYLENSMTVCSAFSIEIITGEWGAIQFSRSMLPTYIGFIVVDINLSINSICIAFNICAGVRLC